MTGDAESSEFRERLAAGDERAFESLFDAYADRLCRYVYAFTRSWEDAENLTQDVFLRLWERREALRTVDNVQAYLYAFARNRARDYLKHQAVETRSAERLGAPLPGELAAALPPEAEERVAAAEAAAAIRQALDTLPARQREVVELRWRRQLTYDEIAAELGLAPKTVATHMSRAILHLRRVLSHLV